MITQDEWNELHTRDIVLINGVPFKITLVIWQGFNVQEIVLVNPNKSTQNKGQISLKFDDTLTGFMELEKFKVTVEDNRPFPQYKNTPIMALTRNTLNEAGWDWNECIELVARIQKVIRDADYLMDDYGNSWAKVTVDK